MNDTTKIGVLVMAYGSPADRDAVEPYYTHIRRGRQPEKDALAELIQRYDAIGGSPLPGITRNQARVLTERLNRMSTGEVFLPFVGFKHASPFIEDAVAAMGAAGIERFVAVAMAPQYSAFSIDGYLQRAMAAARHAGVSMVASVRTWYREPAFTQYWAHAIRQLRPIAGHPGARRAVVFSAHSLPVQILGQHDPYPTEVADSARAIARAAGLGDYTFAWQSAGRTDEPWLGPPIETELRTLRENGVRDFLLCPVGFVADHLEVLYDDDIVCRQLIESLGGTYLRAPMPNANPEFMAAPADAVRRALQRGLVTPA